MASEKQIEANRRNAQQSTGPKTVEGKEKTRMNGLSHGLRAHAVDVLPHESREEFDARIEAYYQDYQPQTEAEDNLVRQAAILSWKIDRADRYEHVNLCVRVLDAFGVTKGKPTIEIERAMDLATFDDSNEGERIRRYQFTLQRAFFRILEILARMRGRGPQRENARNTSGTKPVNRATTAETSLRPAPRPATPPVAPTTEPNFEQILRTSKPANTTTEPNLARSVVPKFAGVTKRAAEAREFLIANVANPSSLLSVSCLKS